MFVCISGSGVQLRLHHPKILSTLVYVAPEIPKSWPYHEPRSSLDVFSGDSQEQDRSQSKHQQHDWDSTREAMSHEVKVSSEPLLGFMGLS